VGREGSPFLRVTDRELRALGFYRHLEWREDGFLEGGQLRFVKTL
jgi:hypothetical protein